MTAALKYSSEAFVMVTIERHIFHARIAPGKSLFACLHFPPLSFSKKKDTKSQNRNSRIFMRQICMFAQLKKKNLKRILMGNHAISIRANRFNKADLLIDMQEMSHENAIVFIVTFFSHHCCELEKFIIEEMKMKKFLDRLMHHKIAMKKEIQNDCWWNAANSIDIPTLRGVRVN